MRILRFLLFFLPIVFMAVKPAVNHATKGSLPDFPPFAEPAGVPLPDENIEKIHILVGDLLKTHRFNGSLLIGYRDHVLFETARGLVNLKSKDSLSITTPFQLASVSKSFTALAVMILVEKGFLKLDDKISLHIHEFPYREITIRQLLNHTSGIPNYMNLAAHYWPRTKPMSNEDMLKLLVKHKLPLNFKPGSRFRYSNTGYAVLALLTERSSGTSFDCFLKENIFDPLQMKHTFVYDRRHFDSIAIPIGHRSSHRNAAVFDYDPVDEVVGDKSIFSTPGDLFLYNKAWTTDILVSKTMRELAFTKGKLKNSQDINYGFGWRFKEVEGRKAIYHNGLWHGFTATYTRLPENELTIIILNNTNAHVSTLAWQIVKKIDPLLPEPLMLASEIQVESED